MPAPATIVGAAIAIAATAVALGGTLTHAALSSSSQLFGPTLIAANDPAQAALTFDDGPNDRTTEALLDILAAHNAHATFFMLGKFVRLRGPLVRRVHAAGHLLGNHTETHPWLHRQPARVIRAELRACNQALEDATGAPVRFFRPPHGARRPAVIQAARELGLTTVQWNAMAKDWLPIGPDRMLANLDRAMARTRRSGTAANILLHDGSDSGLGADRSATLRVTETLLRRFPHQGIRPVTLDAWA